MRNIGSQSFEFVLDEDPPDQYERIGVSERIGLGFMVRESGYVSPLFGPEIYEIKKKFDLDSTKLIDLYTSSSRFYYPSEKENQMYGAFDLYYDGDVYRYEQSAVNENKEDITILKCVSNTDKDNPVVFKTDVLNSKLETDKALALWPLIEKAHR